MTNIDKLKEEIIQFVDSKSFVIGSDVAQLVENRLKGRILQDGFVAVPVEPTEEMIAQGMMHIDDTNMSKALPHVYKAMIAAQEGKE